MDTTHSLNGIATSNFHQNVTNYESMNPSQQRSIENHKKVPKVALVTDNRKLRATALAITAIALIVLGAAAIIAAVVLTGGIAAIPIGAGIGAVIGGAGGGAIALGLITALFVKLHKPTYKGGKFMAGMLANRIQMKQKDLTKCNLIGDGTVFVDGSKDGRADSQWANTVFQTEHGCSLILGAQLQEGHVGQLEKLAQTSGKSFTVLAVLEKWEEEGAHFGMTPARPEMARTHDLHGISIRFGLLGSQHLINQQLIETQDHQAITLEMLDALADQIHQEISGSHGSHVYVHCKSGRGRSAQAIAAYLIKYQGKTVEEAIMHISTARKFADLDKPKLKALLYEFAFQNNPPAYIKQNLDIDLQTLSIEDKLALKKVAIKETYSMLINFLSHSSFSKKGNHDDGNPSGFISPILHPDE